MSRNVSPSSLLTLCFWALVLMGTTVGVMLFSNTDLSATIRPPTLAQTVTGLPPAPSLENLQLPFGEAEESSESSADPATYTGIIDFLRMFTPETDPTVAQPVTDEQGISSTDSSVSVFIPVDDSQCCRIGDSCNEIGELYAADQCAADGGLLEPCAAYCKASDIVRAANALIDRVNKGESFSARSSASAEASSISSESSAAFPTEICGDGIDEDGDLLIDEVDPDCVAVLLNVGAPQAFDPPPPEDTGPIPVPDPSMYQDGSEAVSSEADSLLDAEANGVDVPYPIQNLVIEPIPDTGPSDGLTPEEIAAQQLQQQHDSWWGTMLQFLGL